MAQTGFTPIQIYYSTTTSNVPSAGNLTDGELAINTADGKLFYKDNLGVVRVIAQTSSVTNVSSISFGSTGLTPSAATTGAITVAGTLVAGNGGTGQSTYTTGDLLYATGSTALSKLGIGTNGQILTSTGTAPQWSTLSGVAVTTFSAGTTGFTPSVATSGAITLAGTLATTNGGTGLTTFGAANRAIYSTSSSALTAGTLPTAAGGTGLTSFTANGVVYASSSSVLTTGSALTFDGSTFISRATETVVYPTAGTAQLSLLNGATTNKLILTNSGTGAYIRTNDAVPLSFGVNDSEQMRLTSTGLGIGTSSPTQKLDVTGTGNTTVRIGADGLSETALHFGNTTIGRVSVRSAAPLAFETVATERMRLDSSGNLGLGVTPSAYNTGSAFDIGGRGGLVYYGVAVGNFLALSNNVYYNAGYKYKVSAGAGQMNIGNDGSFSWFNAPSGTAGNAISFTQAMTLDASGQLQVGGTTAFASAGGRGNISINGSGGAILGLGVSNTLRGYFFADASHAELDAQAGYLQFNAGSAERARITSGGNLLVGTTTDPGGSGIIADANGNVRAIPRSGSAKTTSYTLVKGDVGEFIEVGSGGSVTIPDSVFATGDVVSVFNNTTGNITITCSITTAYIAGADSDKATMTLATRGVATILFISGTVCVVSGNVT